MNKFYKTIKLYSKKKIEKKSVMTTNIQESSLFYQKYQIDNEIGRGASGVCYKVKKIEDGRTYALKKISLNFIKVKYFLSLEK